MIEGLGKTATIKLLLGLIRPTAGSASVFGMDSVNQSVDIRTRIGYLPQELHFYEYMTARQTLRFTARFFFKGPEKAIEARVDEMLHLVDLAEKADRPLRTFSGGERQRLGIAQAQVNYPDLLILDEPAARPAFILSKVVANSLGVLATMVVLPGLVAYILLFIGTKIVLDPLSFLAALGVIFLNHLFYLTLTLMLGSFLNSRGPVIGIGLAFLFLQQYLIGSLPVLRYVLPWTLVVPLNNQAEAVVPALLSGQPIYSYLPILAVAVECILFVLISLWRFNREEL